MELISVHVPKTAGVTFRNVLRAVYGPEAVQFDYGDRPLDPQGAFHNDPAAWRAEAVAFVAGLPADTRVVHGHFSADKYAGLFPEARRIVWLREPVARLVSHYHYWRDLPPGQHSLHRSMLDERMSLLDFARLDAMRNVVSRIFLRGCRVEDFGFIGIQEDFAAELTALGRWLGWPAQPAYTDENRNARPDYQAVTLDEDTRAEIARLNADDIALYQQALTLRAHRLDTPSRPPGGQ